MLTRRKRFVLVEPLAKTPYPPLGLMKIGSLLRREHKGCEITPVVGTNLATKICAPDAIYITSLFTWDLNKVVKCVQHYADKFPLADIHIGGIAASLLPEYVEKHTGIRPHIGLLEAAESCVPDYSLSFGRHINASITFASRGCPRKCPFCCVGVHEPVFVVREDWERDVAPDLPRIIFWDNNWLASPNFGKDCQKLRAMGKTLDFNQGLDARLYNEIAAKELSTLRIDPIRFAFDSSSSEKHVLRAIKLARKYSRVEIRVYVLYNFNDTPEDFYHRIDLLNRHRALAFPMEYRKPIPSSTKFPGNHWNAALLRALKLSLIFYYRRGMITESRSSFLSIYGKTPAQFVAKLYEIYEYDKTLKR